MRVERTIDLDAPPDEVYEIVMNPDLLDDWVTIHEGLPEAPNGQLKQGSELTQSLRIAGQRFNVHWKVVQADKPNHVVWEGRGPVRSKARVVYDFEPEGGGTRFSYANEYHSPGGPLGRIADHALAGTSRREADRSLAQLKKLVERNGR
jgi:uncharacterized protein YndB with AHSA1/START domain